MLLMGNNGSVCVLQEPYPEKRLAAVDLSALHDTASQGRAFHNTLFLTHRLTSLP